MRKRINLSATTVYRGGRTARVWAGETKRVALAHYKDGAAFSFSLPSKGGGITEICMEVGSADFRHIVSTLLRGDRRTAMREMASALARELEQQTDHDRAVARVARDSVLEAARKAYAKAPKGRNHAERLTRDMVQELVEQLDEADESIGDAT